MRIAVLGATSQIAKDLIVYANKSSSFTFYLFARSPDTLRKWTKIKGISNIFSINNYDAFGLDIYDVIINFVGAGNPVQIHEMGASIFDVTMHFDQMAINYIRKKPSCLYIFMSSGAAYGTKFDNPVDSNSNAEVAINNFTPQEWYSLAKLYAECRHRALTDLPIIDLRVFNYFSCTQDINSRFLITDIIRAIINNTILYTGPNIVTRDYIHPTDFYQMIQKIINSSPTNDVVDCYSLSPVKKSEMLESMTEKFGLQYEFINNNMGFDATGLKPNYYSLNRRAGKFGFKPSLTSMEGILLEAEKILVNYFNK